MEPYILVAGGAGFIGSNFIRTWIEEQPGSIVSIDKRTYAATTDNLDGLKDGGRHRFVHGDICDRALIGEMIRKYRPSIVVNFAAETHVDRSIHFPQEFVHSNVVGTFILLDEARLYWEGLPGASKDRFRFLQVSTDEVYGSLPIK